MPTIAIVGAGPGLGFSIAKQFGRNGFRVALVSRTQSKLDGLAAQLGQLGDGLVDGRADAGDELDHAAVKLAVDAAALELADLLDDVRRGVQKPSVVGIDHEQLLLEADRERLALAEVVTCVVHGGELVPGTGTGQPPRAAKRTIDVSMSHSTGATSSV